MANINVKEHSELAAENLLNSVNSSLFSRDMFIKYISRKGHRYLQSEVAMLMFEAIRYMASEEYENTCTDGRNDWVVPIAKKLKEALESY